jgi:hypothetical protein
MTSHAVLATQFKGPESPFPRIESHCARMLRSLGEVRKQLTAAERDKIIMRALYYFSGRLGPSLFGS